MLKTPTLGRALIAALGIAFVGTIVWAAGRADFMTSFGAIVADPWGVVSLVDLYLGFALFAVIVVFADGVRPTTFAWVIALCLLGNAVAAAWLFFRWNTVRSRLRALPKA